MTAQEQTQETNAIPRCDNLVALVLARDAGENALCVLPNEPEDGITVCVGPDGNPAPRPLQQFKGNSLAYHTTAMLASCSFAAIDVSVAPDDALISRIQQEIGNMPQAHVSAYDEAAEQTTANTGAHFEVFGLGLATLHHARKLAEANDAEGVLVIPCDLANFQPRHIAKLAEALREHPEADVIASWITWLNRPPYLLRTSFLQSLAESPRCKPRAYHATDRPLPHLNVHEVVFGAEMLSAQPRGTDEEGAFFATCTLSALEAVRMVRAEQAAAAGVLATNPADESLVSRQMNAAFAGKAPTDKRSASDEALLDAARDTLHMLDTMKATRMSAGDQAELARQDAWAHRNKLDFPLFAESENARTLVYLDSAATAQRVGRALDAQYRYDAFENANVYRGAYKLSAQATETFNNARATLERHIGASRRSTIYTANTSTAAALAAQAWGERNVSAQDRILVPENEHHSNILPWMMLAERKKAVLEYIPVDDHGRINMAAYERLLAQRPAPKLVCAAHITNVLGLVNPVKRMAQLAHAAGARFFLDAAQSFAHLPLNVNDLEVDFLALSAHKAYGPMGLGALWASKDAFAEMEPRALGGGTVSHVGRTSYQLRGGAISYELGTPPVSQAVGFAAAIDYLNGLGFDAVQRHGAALTRFLAEGLDAFPDVTVWGDHHAEDGLAGLVSFSLAGIPPKTAASVLGKLGVAVRAGGHCALPLHASMGLVGSIRFSLAVHSTVEDIEAGLVALEVCRRIYGKEALS